MLYSGGCREAGYASLVTAVRLKRTSIDDQFGARGLRAGDEGGRVQGRGRSGDGDERPGGGDGTGRETAGLTLG
jgi:hypothetical protein